VNEMMAPCRALWVLLLLVVSFGARPDVVSTWMDVAQYARERTVRTADNTRASAQVALAMFEVSNAFHKEFRSLLETANVSGLDEEIALHQAARASLERLYPQATDHFDSTYAVLTEKRVLQLGEAAGRSEEFGRHVAEQVLARAALPEPEQRSVYKPFASPGKYVDPGLPLILPWDLSAPPFVLDSARQFRSAAPVALTSAQYGRDVEEVRLLGGKESKARTRAQTLLARTYRYIDYYAILRQVASDPRRTLLQNSRLYALALIAVDEAWLATMDAKMHYSFWRPVTAIRNADGDGNDLTQVDEHWTPLLDTPSHPEYPCGHCAIASGFATVMQHETGEKPAGGITVKGVLASSISPGALNPGITETLASWGEFVQRISDSRIWAGAHFRFSNEAAIKLGGVVGEQVLLRFETLK
jgi:hypothetical protein